jgi:uncharacterized phage protein (TIGR02216 family)
MKIGLGHLRLRPDDFWRMTLPEFLAAAEGYCESKGGGGATANVRPPTRAEIADLSAHFDDQGLPLK